MSDATTSEPTLDDAIATFRSDHHGAVRWEVIEAMFSHTGGPFVRRGSIVSQAFTQWRLYLLWHDTTARLYAVSAGISRRIDPDEPLRLVGETGTYVHSEDWNQILHQFNPDATISAVISN